MTAVEPIDATITLRSEQGWLSNDRALAAYIAWRELIDSVVDKANRFRRLGHDRVCQTLEGQARLMVVNARRHLDGIILNGHSDSAGLPTTHPDQQNGSALTAGAGSAVESTPAARSHNTDGTSSTPVAPSREMALTLSTEIEALQRRAKVAVLEQTQEMALKFLAQARSLLVVGKHEQAGKSVAAARTVLSGGKADD